MKFKNHVIAALALVFSGSVFATPQYSGITTSATPLIPPTAGVEAGYYIWNDANDLRNWSIRWTSPGTTGNQIWSGTVEFLGSSLEEDSAIGIRFESANSDSLVETQGIFDTKDDITFVALTNDSGGFDGIDFSLSGAVAIETIRFDLGSTVFGGLILDGTDPGVASTGIFIGEDYSGTNVLSFGNANYGTQSFEIAVVPEPSVLALFGLGLLGMGAVARRRKQS